MKTKYAWAGGIAIAAILAFAVAAWWKHRHAPEDVQGMMLANAVAAREHKQIRELLARGTNPNARAGGGQTVLAIARGLNDAEAIRMLEDAGATDGRGPKPGRRRLVGHVLSQEWFILKEGEMLTFGGKEHRVYEDMAFVKFIFRLKNLSSEAVIFPMLPALTTETKGKVADVGVEKLSNYEALAGVRLFPGQERMFTAQSVLPAGLAYLKKSQPLYMHLPDFDPEHRKTVPEANITLFHWKAVEIDAPIKFSR